MDLSQIHPAVKEKYPDIVRMILESPSMDDNERKYWLGMLIIMTQEQVDNLKNILVKEQESVKAQKEAKSAQPAGAAGGVSAPLDLKAVDTEKAKAMTEQRKSLTQEEAVLKQEDRKAQDAVLDEIANL